MTALIPPALTVHPTSAYSEPTPLPLLRLAAVNKPGGHEVGAFTGDASRAESESGSSRAQRRRWRHHLLRH